MNVFEEIRREHERGSDSGWASKEGLSSFQRAAGRKIASQTEYARGNPKFPKCNVSRRKLTARR